MALHPGETPMFSANTSRAASIKDLSGIPSNEEEYLRVDTAHPDDDWVETQPLPSGAPSDTEPDDLQIRRQARWKKVRSRTSYYVPGTAWIPNYSVSLLLGDFVAGVTVASILIPQSISYATSLAKLPPLTGLFAAAVPGFIYAILGSSKQLNVGPEASLSLIVGQTVTTLIHSDPHGPPEDAHLVAIAISTIMTFQVGLFTFLLGFVRLGFIDVILSRALLRGFVTAVAVVITVEQIIPMLGLAGLERIVNPTTTPDKVAFIIDNISSINKPTAILSFTTLFLLIFMRTVKRHFTAKHHWVYFIPEIFLTVVVSTLLSSAYRWDKHGISILGDVALSKDDSYFQFPLTDMNLSWFKVTTPTAILLSVIGFLDSLVSAKQNSGRFGYSISLNRELVALGAGNLGASFIPGTLPAFGAITRSKLNAELGGRSQMASLVCSSIVMLAIFFLLPALHFLPKCVLAAIICLVVVGLVQEAPEDIHFFWSLGSWRDLGLMTLTFLLTTLWSVEVGVAVSVTISLLLVVHRSSRARMSILGRVPGTDKWKPIQENPDAEETVPGVLIIRIRESLDFANTSQLKERLRRLELYGMSVHHPGDAPRRQQATVLVFHMSDVESCDASATQIFLELLQTYKTRGVTLYIAHLRDQPMKLFQKAGIAKLLGEEAFQPNIAAVIQRIEAVDLAR
ncbi:hypothetical protein M408DRAFT_260748 [Serendipita vermifera MAFF 305830]|uniref:STAS domain-containing protein n=1 Tax=Serendipita vermifera MAFF 305830 TaxID=933852 RepID=A0A0C3BH48_SERVB|nr:hypothetical protein M408DRAFT_260748 [Serendipita vermifera MAFF 305830]